MAQRRCLLVHASHRVFYEGGIGHVCRPGVPSVDERRAALLVPLNANAKAFSPDGVGEKALLTTGIQMALHQFSGIAREAEAWCNNVTHLRSVTSQCLGDAESCIPPM